MTHLEMRRRREEERRLVQRTRDLDTSARVRYWDIHLEADQRYQTDLYQAGRDSGILRREKTRSKEEERRRKQAKRTWKSGLRLMRNENGKNIKVRTVSEGCLQVLQMFSGANENDTRLQETCFMEMMRTIPVSRKLFMEMRMIPISRKLFLWK